MRRATIRTRLTALYGGLFLATSVVLLILMNVLLEHNLRREIAGVPGLPLIAVQGLEPTLEPRPGTPPPPRRRESAPAAPALDTAVRDAPALQGLADAVLRYQWFVASGLIAAFSVVSIFVGWWLAGRVLRPLHHMTETTRRLSASNLHERIQHTGPPDELSLLADTLDDMLERLEASVERQRRFIANAAHELRTPLATQRIAIQVGLDDPSRERLERVREELLEINRRNERLIDGLLILAQGEHGLATKEPVALDALVRQAVSETSIEGGITLTQHAEPSIIDGDAVLLHRVIANLLHNAVRYNRKNGYVDVRVTSAGGLTVRNTGPEIPEHRISEMFEPFRRLDSERTGSNDGAGLGLSIVASIARAHDAAITARPNPGGGLELTIQFRALPPDTV